MVDGTSELVACRRMVCATPSPLSLFAVGSGTARPMARMEWSICRQGAPVLRPLGIFADYQAPVVREQANAGLARHVSLGYADAGCLAQGSSGGTGLRVEESVTPALQAEDNHVVVSYSALSPGLV